MKTRMLLTGLAVTTALLLAPSAMAVNTTNSGHGGTGLGGLSVPPDSSLGGGGDNYNLPPDSSLGGGAGAIRFDPTSNDDLASEQDASIVRILTLRYIPITFKWLGAALH